MPRCIYCHRAIPSFEEICEKCFEGRSDKLDHPAPWWHFHWLLAPRLRWRRPRFTRITVYIFLFVFTCGFLRLRLELIRPPAMKTCLLLAFVIALLEAFLGSSLEDRRSDSTQK